MYPSFMQLSKNTNEILKCKMAPDGESTTCAVFQFLTLEALKHTMLYLINYDVTQS